MFDLIIEKILGLVAQYPIVSSVLLVIGALRLLMKPLMTFLHEVVLIVPGTKDDELLEKVEKSKVYSVIVFVLDWLGSIKLKK